MIKETESSEFAKRSSKDMVGLSVGALVGSILGITAETVTVGLGLEAIGAFAPTGGAILGGAVGVAISELQSRKSRREPRHS